MIEGGSKFTPWPIQDFYNPIGPDETLEKATRKLNDAVFQIREWQTLMNIFGYKGWTDPLTGDLHIIVRHGKLVSAEHIGDAVEVAQHDYQKDEKC
jgi:hypothetical protein